MAECWKDYLGTYAGNQVGTWGYSAGTANGGDPDLVLSGSKKILGIRMLATAASSFTIDGGNTISMSKNEVWWDNPLGNLQDPTFAWSSGTIRYYIEYVV